MPEQILQVNEEAIKSQLGELVRKTVEETLNELLEKEADELLNAARYERSVERAGYRAGHYERGLTTSSGQIALKMPKLKGATFETAIIERYRRRESSVEEAIVEMYLAGVSVRRVEDITEALWGAKVSASTVSSLNQKAYENIEKWRSQPIEGEYPYVYVDGIWLKRSWGGEVGNVSVLVAVGVDIHGYRAVLGACEGMRESAEDWRSFFLWLRDRGLKGVQLVIGDKRSGLGDAAQEVFGCKYQRCMVHFFRNVLNDVPKAKREAVSLMLKAIYAQESKEAARKKAAGVVQELHSMKLAKAAMCLQNGLEETLVFYSFPPKHWRLVRTTNMLERVNKEIRRRTRVVGAFPDGNSALMLVCARLRYVAGSQWGIKRYMSMQSLYEPGEALAGNKAS